MGYDVSDGYTSNGTGGGKGSGGPAALDDPKLIFGVTDRASKFIESQAKSGHPFFVQVSHYAVHLDIYYREETLRQTQASSGQKHSMPEFAAMTADMDTGIGMLMDKIRELGLQENTYIFFLSDNGGRRSIPGQQTPELPRNHPLRDGKGTMYEGGLRVPFIVIGPDVQPGSVSRTPVTGLDIFPTIAELAGYPNPLPTVLDGGSMTGVLGDNGQGKISRNHPFLVFHHAVDRTAQTALIQGDYKLVKTWKDDRLELFDLSQDISEEDDLSDRMPEKTEELHGLILDYLAETNATSRSMRDEREANDSATTPAPRTYKISTQAEFDALEPLVYNGGDQILFERGARFDGALSLKRSRVRPDSVITVGDFGSAEAPRPVIKADADGMGTIDIRDSGGWTVENLEIINQSAVRSERHGIFVTASDSGTHKNFVIRNCLIHDVTGIHDFFNNGGIVFRVVGNTVPTDFDGILIENNEIRNISGVGIRTKSTWEADPDDPRGVARPIGRHAHLNVVVRGNRISDVTRNAIIIGSADAPLAEYNVMGPKIATETTGNTIYNYATDDAVIQYNEAFGNHGPAEDKDRGGFDADYNSRNTVFRYNYSHDNNFAFAIMRKYGDGIYFHHNISINDRYGFIHYGFYDDHAISDVVVSNNTFYSTHPDMMMFMNFGPPREPIDTSFVDNVFVFAGGGARWGSEPSAERGNIFENNVVVGLEDPNYIKLTDDPLFVAPGSGGTEIDMTDPDRLGGYRLCLGSVAIGKGREDDNAATTDFWGNAVKAMNIGAYGGEGQNCE
jgi:hypothetical protein